MSIPAGTSAGRAEPLWVRVGGGFEEVCSRARHGPADPDYPPPGGPWEAVWLDDRLVGWAPPDLGRDSLRRALVEGERIARDRRAYLIGRLGHKLRSSALALQEFARQAAYGRHELFEEVYEQARDVARRAQGLETVALDPKDPPRAVVLGAVLGQAAAGARRRLPSDAVVRAREPVLRDALGRAYEWLGGDGTTITGELNGNWWRLEVIAAPERRPLTVSELGEPLVRHLIDTLLDGWLDSGQPDRAVIYLPAV